MTAPLPSPGFMSIGEVLGQLRTEFPDITISKIRFLESEGLVEPQRTPSGYRKFSPDDLSRLRHVLTAQRDQYLPLRVIKEQLAAVDRGAPPAGADTGRAAADSSPGLPGPEAFAPDSSELRLSRGELLAGSGLTEEALGQLEQFGLLSAGAAGHYDGDALTIARTAAELARFGIEPRHLRPAKAAADREVGLVEQVINPLIRHRNPDGRARAEEASREIAALSIRLHAALVKVALRPALAR